MDSERFDDLTRAVAARLPRRAAVRWLAGAALGVRALAGDIDAAVGKKKRKKNGKRKKKGGRSPAARACSPPCGDCELCVDGVCGSACAACETCRLNPGIECVSLCDAKACQVCDPDSGQCVSACGECDYCIDGACTPTCGSCETCRFTPALECVPKCDADRCEWCSERDGACVSTCGDCEICIDGACEPACRPCETCRLNPSIVCESDPDLACFCDDAPPGLIYCPDEDRCIDAKTDKDHCGGCGRWCPPCGDQCPDLAEDFVCCDGACRYIEEDRNNCGACGMVCGYEEECRKGQCGPACLEGTFCGRNPTQSNPLGWYQCTSETHQHCYKSSGGQWLLCGRGQFGCRAQCEQAGTCGPIPDECRRETCD